VIGISDLWVQYGLGGGELFRQRDPTGLWIVSRESHSACTSGTSLWIVKICGQSILYLSIKPL
jgi:hypothetical protein